MEVEARPAKRPRTARDEDLEEACCPAAAAAAEVGTPGKKAAPASAPAPTTTTSAAPEEEAAGARATSFLATPSKAAKQPADAAARAGQGEHEHDADTDEGAEDDDKDSMGLPLVRVEGEGAEDDGAGSNNDALSRREELVRVEGEGAEDDGAGSNNDALSRREERPLPPESPLPPYESHGLPWYFLSTDKAQQKKDDGNTLSSASSTGSSAVSAKGGDNDDNEARAGSQRPWSWGPDGIVPSSTFSSASSSSSDEEMELDGLAPPPPPPPPRQQQQQQQQPAQTESSPSSVMRGHSDTQCSGGAETGAKVGRDRGTASDRPQFLSQLSQDSLATTQSSSVGGGDINDEDADKDAGPEDADYYEEVASSSGADAGIASLTAKELSEADADTLRGIVKSLAAKNASLRLENDDLRKRSAKLSPAVYTVHGPKTVSKMRLGRTASVATREELTRLLNSPGSPMPQSIEELSFNERMDNLIRGGPAQCQEYLSSADFADELLSLCSRAAKIFSREKRVLELSSPLYVFGDLHGNFEDLQFFAEHVWPMGARLCAGKLLFLGDYVDRGEHGLELLAYLLAQKTQVPDKVFMIRGNHETRAVNGWEAYYGSGSFVHQCQARFGQEKGLEVWEACNRVFDTLPLASVVDESIFCVHGGIPCPSPSSSSSSSSGPAQAPDRRIDDMRALPCPMDIHPPMPEDADDANRLAFSLLWADPADANQEDSLKGSESGFAQSARGGGTVVFGSKAVHDFLEQNRLDYIMRAHEATANGVGVCKSAKVLTVFSTSKDHGCGSSAKCGCVLVDRNRIQAITRSAQYKGAVFSSTLGQESSLGANAPDGVETAGIKDGEVSKELKELVAEDSDPGDDLGTSMFGHKAIFEAVLDAWRPESEQKSNLFV